MDGIPIPRLRSSRLVLRKLEASDHPKLLDMAHDPEVTRFLNEGPPPSAGELWQRMMIGLGHWGLRGYGMLAIDDAEGFVGRIGFYHPYSEPEPLLVYVLNRRSWGQGYATEAVTLIRDWMFEVHMPQRIVSYIMKDNAASAGVASKLGAVLEGTLVQRGAKLDVWCYRTPK